MKQRHPVPTVDVLIEFEGGVILIKRKNPPPGWAIPGGFVDYGESLETAAWREIREETGMELEELVQFHAYSAPGRDPRLHTISTVFIGKGLGRPRAGSDAEDILIVRGEPDLPEQMAFDHRRIVADYLRGKLEGRVRL